MRRIGAYSLFLVLAALPAAAEPDLSRIKELKALVADDCGACHGLTRQGGLGPPLTQAALKDLSEEGLEATILDGRPDTPMPPWRGLLSEADVRWIVRYLKGEPDASRR